MTLQRYKNFLNCITYCSNFFVQQLKYSYHGNCITISLVSYAAEKRGGHLTAATLNKIKLYKSAVECQKAEMESDASGLFWLPLR